MQFCIYVQTVAKAVYSSSQKECNFSIHGVVHNLQAKTHEKVDSIGEERSIACHTVVMLIKNGS